MKIYIASSWKNQHIVEMLTEKLRSKGENVISWIENNYGENNAPTIEFNFEKWIKTESAQRSFNFDIDGATSSDLVIYIGPSGTDAWAEIGAAYGSGIPVILGLWAKGEPSGLMRKMISKWFFRYHELLEYVDKLSKKIKGKHKTNGKTN